MKIAVKYFAFVLVPFICLILFSCHKKDDVIPNNGKDTTKTPPVYYPDFSDDYASIASRSDSNLWGPYNLHDPSVIKSGDSYYIFSTDVAYGPNGKCGIMWRTSKDLVKWQFRGWVFNGVPAKALQFMEVIQTGYQQTGIWAPYIIKVGEKFRLYYAVPGNNGAKFACIALATTTSPTGPWTDEGIVISCYPADNYNAIDPAVIVDANNGRQWMTYGSYSAGIFIVELDPSTGFRLNAGDKGKLVAFRKKFGDAIEGADILYNSELKKYFLFVSYDWLEDTYNVRVARSDNPDGPYYDIAGNDMAAVGDKLPMITAEYKFENHPGWQGFGGCTELHDGTSYYYVSQARLSSNKYFMDLHIHRMVWTPDGWPTISPERYVNVPQDTISLAKIVGKWEHLDLVKTASQNQSIEITLNSDGTITGIDNAQWQYQDSILSLSYNSAIYKARVFSEWDWENKKRTIVYTGMNSTGYCIWGKKIL